MLRMRFSFAKSYSMIILLGIHCYSGQLLQQGSTYLILLLTESKIATADIPTLEAHNARIVV